VVEIGGLQFEACPRQNMRLRKIKKEKKERKKEKELVV
jgi:hypothetical protein